MSDQIYSPIIFIGREKEIALFEQMLEKPDDGKWILHLHGQGGIGKTQLLHRFIKIAEESEHNVLITGDLIDLYWTANQRELGILKSIADHFIYVSPMLVHRSPHDRFLARESSFHLFSILLPPISAGFDV